MFNYEQMMENILAKTGKRPPQQPSRPFVPQPQLRDVNEMPVLAPSKLPMPNAPNIQPEAVNQPRFQAPPPPNLEYSASDSRNTQIAELEDLITNPDRKDDPANQMGWKGRVGYGTLRGAGIGAQSGNVGQAVGGALGGLLVGIFDKKGEAKRQNQGKLAQLYKMRDVDNQQIEEEQQQRMRKAQTDTIYNDDAVAKERIRIAQDDLTRKVTDSEKRASAAEARNAINLYKSMPEIDTATPEGQQFAQEFEQSTGLPLIPKNAKTKSNYYFSEDGKVYLAQSDEQGNTTFAEYVNDDGTSKNFQTKGMRASNDKELERKFKGEEGTKNRSASITRTQILANAGITKVGMQQAGANYRTQYSAQAKTAFEAFQQANRLILSAKNAEEKAKYQAQAAEYQKEYIRLRAEMDKQP